ncbi:hypothetical protein KIN20_036561 [Parelaphostrongylus tenuis]|uniref:Uncharacterized protein n=1 Tax=Parelaphostrongylus tenuis TaxID=148309 RepID=A0AAD5RDB1_PARTN|nr:hypothetical protein KIN20_036561 [Parelaphostrongylus tenuis]
MSQNRSLGEGRICRMVKKHAYINDERLGNVYFPIAAACITSDCTDLRDKFTSDEEVIFTAQRQTQVQNDCRFVASSVVKKRELISVTGKISDTYDKFCYADVKKYGRVFVPYSSRNDFNKPWLGKGAEVGKIIQMKIFRQPDINNCRYVAWSINMNQVDEKKASEKVPDVANGQIGVIVVCPEDGDLAVYSSQSGTARLPSSLRKPWMSLGTCIRYDLIRKVDAESRPVWVVRSVENLGLLYEVIDDEMDSSKLLLRLHAVVNRVSLNARSAWLWNDVIGRIFVPAQQFNHGLRAMVCVKLIVVWTGLFEDVPWSATHIDVLGDDAHIRVRNASLLQTDDNWTVSNINTNEQKFFGFMNNPKYGSAFIAWTDLTEGDTPPRPDTKCRATVFFQLRNGKHPWRAVLVTPLGSDGYPMWHHPLHYHSGQLSLPEHPFKLPPPVLPPTTAPVNGPKTPTLVPNEVVTQPDSVFPPIVTHVVSTSSLPLSPIVNGVTQVSPLPHVFSSDSSEAYSDRQGLDAFDLDSYKRAFLPWNDTDFFKWAPRLTPLSLPDFDPFPLSVSRSSSTSATNDVSTQTDVLSEHQVLTDIINNKDLFDVVIKYLPQHWTRFVDFIRWQKR